jgi:hypothetical protein
MHDGVYSIVLARRRMSTGHVSTVCPAKEITLTTNNIIQVMVPAFDTANGQDAWTVYGSLQGQSTAATTFEGRNGPWYRLGDIVTLGSGGPSYGPFNFEWRNEEIAGGDSAQFNNDPPPDASYLASLNDVICLLGCHGKGDTRPGPGIVASKPADPESYPASAVSFVNPAERIVGVLEAIGKIYPMTENRLHITTLTGVDASPLTTRPFWGSGFKHQQAAVLIGDKVYGFSGGRPTRSGAEESIDQEDHTFASRVQDIVASWVPAKVIVGHDPKNRAVVFIHSNDHVRNGKRVSVALCYMLETERWSGLMILRDPNDAADFVVSGVTTLSGLFSVIAGNKIWQWDTPTHGGSVGVPWYITTPWLDANQPMAYKTISKVEVTARTQDDIATATVGLYKNNDMTGLGASYPANPSAVSGPKNLKASSDVSVSTIWRTKLREAKTFAVRIEGVWPAGDPLVSIDEIAINGWSVLPFF